LFFSGLCGNTGINRMIGTRRMNEGGKIMKSEVIEKIAALVTAAFGLVAALAWNGAIQAPPL
jgi:hypothetical protein